jgi:hypothetical protein
MAVHAFLGFGSLGVDAVEFIPESFAFDIAPDFPRLFRCQPPQSVNVLYSRGRKARANAFRDAGQVPEVKM